ncbi:ethanolamine utilization protein EutJ [Kineosporia sp. A_224]|uniref:ethanolamine utilization protein EutJ n=1 Tax=Kineosporia sp. A_224 TaxID=1962180 RepID=UPI000B4BFB1E|nr:ethanolamine utilization protein EutJ [Kineosporia sp. A_224]
MTSEPAADVAPLDVPGPRDPSLLLAATAERLGRGAAAHVAAGPLRVGVDLGTATTVVLVLDIDGAPVWADSLAAHPVRDGVVVDFHGAARAVRTLRARAEADLGRPLPAAACAAPPGVPAADSRACVHVCEAAGFDEVTLTDEVSAAQRVLEVRDGVVVDVGGGSTGVGVFRAGALVALDDRPGGGHHVDLVLAGGLGIGVEDAERLKREDPTTALPVVVPAVERVAESVRRMTLGAKDLPVHLVGGGLMLPGAAAVVERWLDRPVHGYPHALLVTPVGIARSAP